MRRFERLINLLLVVALLLSQLPQMSQYVQAAPVATDPAYFPDGSDEGFVAEDNGFIKYYVSKADGGFTILPSTIPFDESKATSFGSFRMNGKDYVFGRSQADDAAGKGILVPPFINELGTCQTSWIKDGYTITQFINIVQE